MRQAVRLDRLARRFLGCLGADRASRLCLSLFFKAVLGIQRIFHFSTLQDPGLAILTGGRKVLSREQLGSWLRQVPTRAVQALLRDSEPTVPRHPEHTISIDEHCVPRFTRKFRIKKGYHTIRNKFMPVEKLFFSFHLGMRSLLSLIVTRGNGKLCLLAHKLRDRLRPRVRGATVYLLLDAGAAQNTDSLLRLVEVPDQITIVRTPRRPAYRRQWEKLPASAWQRLEEPGPYSAAPPKVIHVAQTVTQLRDTRQRPGRSYPVRTIIVREAARRGKERWHALWVFGDDTTPPYKLVERYRQRQHHEQRYRILLHDAFVDTAPSGYNKRSRNPTKPGFLQNALPLYAWLCGLATDALERLGRRLGNRFLHAHPRTLRRYWLCIPAELYLLGTDRLLVVLRVKRLRSLWETLIRRANSDPVRIPWLQNRKLLLALDKKIARPKSAGVNDPATRGPGVWC